MGGTRVIHGLTMDNSPNSELANSWYTGPLLKIIFLEEVGRGVCGSAVAKGARFACHLWMNETFLHRTFQENL